jgi:hypothetical protein
MLRTCDVCPRSENVEKFIRNIFTDFDDEAEVNGCPLIEASYKQCSSLYLTS